jgi:hypothetical protein
LRRSARPPMLGGALSHELRKHLEYVPILISLGALIFEYDLYGKISAIPLYSLILAILLKEVLCRAKVFHKYNVVNYEFNKYEQLKFIFLTDYERENPVTREDATEKFF